MERERKPKSLMQGEIIGTREKDRKKEMDSRSGTRFKEFEENKMDGVSTSKRYMERLLKESKAHQGL